MESYTNADVEYLNLAKTVLEKGIEKDDRTGTGTISTFGNQMEFDLKEGFPLLTTKRLPFRIIAEELFWFISGDTNLKTLLDKNVNIWTPDGHRDFNMHNPVNYSYKEFEDFAARVGYDLGPIYGKQWRSWQSRSKKPIDQLQNVINNIVTNPNSRRHLVSVWNPGELSSMALPPCHVMFQFYVANGELSCKLYQRSGDLFLGVPFNIASYALLTHLVAHTLDLKVGKFIHTFGDVHIYKDHVTQLQTQLQRLPKNAPKLHIKAKHEYIEQYNINDIELIGYDPHPKIKGNVSVGK